MKEDYNMKMMTDDFIIIAYLACKGHQIKPHKMQDGRVYFVARGDSLKDLHESCINIKEKFIDFIKMIEMVRISIFALMSVGEVSNNGQ